MSIDFWALIFIAIATSTLGVFVLWKRLSFFGDAVSHSILLGVALGCTFGATPDFSLIFFAVLFALLVNFASKSNYFTKDTIIAISSYFCVALALIINDFLGRTIDFESYIFGDISSVTNSDLAVLAIIAIICVIFAIFAFKKLLLINISTDLAKIEGIKIENWNLFFMIILTITIALCVKIVGVLLMTALLILPAAIARLFAKNSLEMLIGSIIFSILICAICGILAPQYNLSVGPLIILMLSAIFMPLILFKK